MEDGKPEDAEAKIMAAWDLLPEPKFNTSCSQGILSDPVEVLTRVGKHKEAKSILGDWINDLESCGYNINETLPYILLGENHLYLDEIDEAKQKFYRAVKVGAGKRDFSDKPAFYFDGAKKKITDNAEVSSLFE